MTRNKKDFFCKNCNKLFHPHYSSYGIYCSLKCQYEYTRKSNISLWLDGKIKTINTIGLIRPFIRRHLIEKLGSKCMICGWHEVNKFTKLIPLEIDHIDGNYENNEISNLRLLCPNCHSLTATYKNSNRGKGRPGRVGKNDKLKRNET